MKPTRNRIFCISCRRPKMLFESREKADNFIRFNSDEMVSETGKAPVRSYYCALCCGWHVTSNPSTVRGEIMDGRDAELISMLEAQKRSRPAPKQAPQKKEKVPKPVLPEFIQLCNSIGTVKQMMRCCELERAESALEDISGAALELDPEVLPLENRDVILERVKGCEKVLGRFREVVGDSAAVAKIMASPPGVGWNALLRAMVRRREYGRIMEEGFASIERLNDEGRPEEAEAVAAGLSAMIPKTKSIYNIKERRAWEKRLKELTSGHVYGKESREKLLMALSRAELAAKAASEGQTGLCFSYIEDARRMLSKAVDCLEKDGIRSFLDDLEEKL